MFKIQSFQVPVGLSGTPRAQMVSTFLRIEATCSRNGWATAGLIPACNCWRIWLAARTSPLILINFHPQAVHVGNSSVVYRPSALLCPGCRAQHRGICRGYGSVVLNTTCNSLSRIRLQLAAWYDTGIVLVRAGGIAQG